MARHLVAPKGKFRVVGFDLYDQSDYEVGDFDTEGVALSKANKRNAKRPSVFADIWYVYDDTGKVLNEMLGWFRRHT